MFLSTIFVKFQEIFDLNIRWMMYEIETKDFSKDKEKFDFCIYSGKSKHNYLSKLVVGNMTHETGIIATE